MVEVVNLISQLLLTLSAVHNESSVVVLELNKLFFQVQHVLLTIRHLFIVGLVNEIKLVHLPSDSSETCCLLLYLLAQRDCLLRQTLLTETSRFVGQGVDNCLLLVETHLEIDASFRHFQ